MITARRLTFFALLVTVLLAAPSAAMAGNRADVQTTELLSRTPGGGVPNGASGNSVISGDKRFARVIAYESDASDLVAGDTNGQRDVFAVRRAGSFGNEGSPWAPGNTVLISRTASGQPANGPSFAPSIDGAFQDAETVAPSCVGFLSAATNLVAGDTNGMVDAFVAPIGSGAPRKVSPDGAARHTAVAVSGNCSRIAMVTGGQLYVTRRQGPAWSTRRRRWPIPPFGVGRNQDLVFATPNGVSCSRTARPARSSSRPAAPTPPTTTSSARS